MNHLKAGRGLGRNPSHRKALYKNQLHALLKYERIITTEAKAKELRKLAERMITLGKKGSLHARRQAFGFIRDRELLKRLFENYAPRFKERHGGYTRILKLGERKGDRAPLALIEFLPPPEGRHKLITKKEKKDKAISKEEKRQAKEKREKEKFEKREKKQELKAKAEAEKAFAIQQTMHTKTTLGRRTAKGMGRSGGTKKGVS